MNLSTLLRKIRQLWQGGFLAKTAISIAFLIPFALVSFPLLGMTEEIFPYWAQGLLSMALFAGFWLAFAWLTKAPEVEKHRAFRTFGPPTHWESFELICGEAALHPFVTLVIMRNLGKELVEASQEVPPGREKTKLENRGRALVDLTSVILKDKEGEVEDYD